VAINGFVDAYEKGSHFRKHRNEFGGLYATADDYENAAIAFFVCVKSKTMVDCTRKGGDYILYDKSTNTMAICRRDGTLRTFFKPDKMRHRKKDNMRYFRSTCKE
jgi:pyocin large subunit-like protein